MIGDTVRYLKDHGKFVIYDAEHSFDGYKDDPEYRCRHVASRGKKRGADFVVLCDTNGGTLPHEVSALIDQPRVRQTRPRGKSAFTRTTTSVSAWPTPWPASPLEPRTCKAPSTATASAPATATLDERGARRRVQVEETLPSGKIHRPVARPFPCSWTTSPTCATIRASRGSARLAFAHKGGDACERRAKGRAQLRAH